VTCWDFKDLGGRHRLPTRRLDIVGAYVARAADKGLFAHVGLDQTAGGGEMGVVCRFVTHPSPYLRLWRVAAIQHEGVATWSGVSCGSAVFAGSGLGVACRHWCALASRGAFSLPGPYLSS
jgi:hypothetical protein